MRIGITGATGFIGRRLVELASLEPDLQVRVFARDARRARALFPIPSDGISPLEVVEWDYARQVPGYGALGSVDVIVHLAGENIAARRWSGPQKKKIRDSRVLSTRHLIEGMKRAGVQPRAVICGSAVGYYGPQGDEEITEESPPGSDFLADVCQDWEAEARRAEFNGVRVVALRTGVVLGPGGGALVPMVRATKMCAGGPLGSGKQWMSWIHRDDLARLILHAIKDDTLHGGLNGTAPNPVRNREFARELGSVLQRPSFLPAPALGMRVLLGEVAEILVTGQRVLPAKALASGFEFHYPELGSALRQILAASTAPVPA